MFLAKTMFRDVIKNTPLISIDLIIQNDNKKILLGLRKNSPARGYWFVPGGRILKDEKIEQAFNRICCQEIGLEQYEGEVEELGIYEHFYNDNFFNQDFTTHYIVLAKKIFLSEYNLQNYEFQHEGMQWFDINEILTESKVHNNTKAYFLKG